MMAEYVRPDAVIEQLQESLDDGAGLCLLAGAGLTISATGELANSWPELIKRGAVACEENGRRDLPWVDRVAADVGTGETWDMLAAAEKVTYGLGGPTSPQFAKWLRGTVGTLEPRHFELLDQVKRLASHPYVVVVTTNYDGLLAKHLDFERVTWKDDEAVLVDAFSRHVKAVIHIHGYWMRPSSVVFGSASYAALSATKTAFEGLEKMLFANAVVTVGVGAGITDPTFKVLLDWADQALKRARAIFYLHVAGAKVPEHPGIVCVPLPSYAGIAEFLQQIEVKPWERPGDRPRRRRRAAFGRHPGMDTRSRRLRQAEPGRGAGTAVHEHLQGSGRTSSDRRGNARCPRPGVDGVPPADDLASSRKRGMTARPPSGQGARGNDAD